MNWNSSLVFSVVKLKAVIGRIFLYCRTCKFRFHGNKMMSQILNSIFWNASFCPPYSHVLKLWCHEMSDFPVKSNMNASGDLYVSPCFKEHMCTCICNSLHFVINTFMYAGMSNASEILLRVFFFPFNIPFLIYWYCRGKTFIL